MFAYCIAAAHLELPHQLIDSLMISAVDANGEGWPFIDQIPAAEVCSFAKFPDHSKYAVPSVVHLCQRYVVGKEWFFAKRKLPSDVYDCDVPLFKEPPDDLATIYDYQWPPNGQKKNLTPKEIVRESFMICYLYSIVNEAATFYKKSSCSAETINVTKSRDLVQLFHEDRNKKVDKKI
jgi:peptidyl serine alpha-galactosyltransferase